MTATANSNLPHSYTLPKYELALQCLLSLTPHFNPSQENKGLKLRQPFMDVNGKVEAFHPVVKEIKKAIEYLQQYDAELKEEEAVIDAACEEANVGFWCSSIESSYEDETLSEAESPIDDYHDYYLDGDIDNGTNEYDEVFAWEEEDSDVSDAKVISEGDSNEIATKRAKKRRKFSRMESMIGKKDSDSDSNRNGKSKKCKQMSIGIAAIEFEADMTVPETRTETIGVDRESDLEMNLEIVVPPMTAETSKALGFATNACTPHSSTTLSSTLTTSSSTSPSPPPPKSFEFFFEKLTKFKKRYGHCNLLLSSHQNLQQERNERSSALGTWCDQMRLEYEEIVSGTGLASASCQRAHHGNTNSLTTDRIQMLEGIGFTWNTIHEVKEYEREDYENTRVLLDLPATINLRNGYTRSDDHDSSQGAQIIT